MDERSAYEADIEIAYLTEKTEGMMAAYKAISSSSSSSLKSRTSRPEMMMMMMTLDRVDGWNGYSPSMYIGSTATYIQPSSGYLQKREKKKKRNLIII